MKRTIWRPVALGIIMGVLAGTSVVTDLMFFDYSPETSNAIGFYMTLMLLANALGGPLAAVIAPSIFITMSAYLGPPYMQELMREPNVFWSNLVVMGALMLFIGLGYRVIYERLSMPARLLPWAGLVVGLYIANIPIIMGIQFYLAGTDGLLAAILDGYRDYIPQMLLDIFITSLVFIALPAAYRRPLWYATTNSQTQDEQLAVSRHP